MPFRLTVIVGGVLGRLVGPGPVDDRHHTGAFQFADVVEELLQVVPLVLKIVRFRVGRQGDVRDEDLLAEKRLCVLGTRQGLRVDAVV